MFSKWMIHRAIYSDKKRSMPWLRLIFDKFDIKPNLYIKKRELLKHYRETDIPLIGHIHVPKTGGTYTSSLQNVLPHINFSHVLVRNDRSDKYCPVGFTPIAPKKVNGFYLFSNVRNPLTFLISYYHHVKGFVGYKNPNHWDYEYAQQGFDYLVKIVLNRTDKWPGRKFLFPQLFDQEGICIIDRINRTETLDEDLKSLCKEFGLEFKSKERKRVAPKKKTPEEYYSNVLYDEVVNVYSREMQMFGYEGFDLQTNEYQSKNNFTLIYDYARDEFIEKS
jgi:hypothetical protein